MNSRPSTTIRKSHRKSLPSDNPVSVEASPVIKKNSVLKPLVSLSDSLSLGTKRLNDLYTKIEITEYEIETNLKKIEENENIITKSISIIGCVRDFNEIDMKKGKKNNIAAVSSQKGGVLQPMEVVTEFLQNKPVLLSIFFDNMGIDAHNIDFIMSLYTFTYKAYPLFFGYALRQLSRFSHCNGLIKDLNSIIEEDFFLKSLKDAFSSLLPSADSIVFLKDQKYDVFSLIINEKTYFFNLNEECIPFNTLRSSEIQIIQGFDDIVYGNIDTLVNPNKVPMIIVPIGSDGIVSLLFPSTLFSNEDVEVIRYFCTLLKPIVSSYSLISTVNKEVKERRLMHYFETEISTKLSFQTLLPFLMVSLNECIGANDVELYLVEKRGISCFEVQKDTLIRKNYTFIGIPGYIAQKNEPFITKSVDPSQYEFINRKVDEWTIDKTFVGYPVVSSSDEVIGVLCVSDKDPDFSPWDIEFIQNVSSTLSLVMPSLMTCRTSDVGLYKSFARFVGERSISSMESSSFFNEFVNEMCKCLKCEYYSFHIIKNGTSSERYSSFNGLTYENPIVTDTFIRFVIENEKQLINSSSPLTVKSFVPMMGFDTNSILSYSTSEKMVKICVFAINSLDQSKNFTHQQEEVFKASSTVIMLSLYMIDLQHNLNSVNSSIQTINDYLASFKQCLGSENLLEPLFSSICTIIGNAQYCLWRYQSLSQTYIPVVCSSGVKLVSIPHDDVLFSTFDNISDYRVLDRFALSPYFQSEIIQIFQIITSVLIWKIYTQGVQFFVVFVSDKFKPIWKQCLDFFQPLLSASIENELVKNKTLSPTDFVLENVHFVNQTILEPELASRQFNIFSLTDSQKIETLIKIFKALQIVETLGITDIELARFFIELRNNYKNNPFHNWDHIIETTQFGYYCMNRGRFRKFFQPHEITAIFLAIVCHDIGHEGLTCEYYIKSKSELTIAYGTTEPLEKYHLHLAIDLIQSTTFGKALSNDFWEIFCECILSTNVSRHQDVSLKIATIVDGFESYNPEHRKKLANFLMVCCNLSNTARPFQISSKFASLLHEEMKNQIIKQKSENISLSYYGEGFFMQDLPSIELSFYTNKVFPMFRMLPVISPELSDLVIQLEDNKSQWDSIKKGITTIPRFN